MIMFESFIEYKDKLIPPSGAITETVDAIRQKIQGRGGAVLVWAESEPVGSAQYYVEEDYLYIGRISVLPAWRGRGIGRRIVAYLEDTARTKGLAQVRLEVRQSLPENVNYYTKLNYVLIQEHEYPCKRDRWYTMSKSLSERHLCEGGQRIEI
ncbi:GNAT family N-acetyltransferase [Paenibacillus turpanensis]|uniref:GNAT family N-acetyltransferase n=1 Tax=Paenibacillus turpanensis TaxID=2689078 RepID=UPI001409E8B8|nr:GNAT family N-acetyltransferase [Paenibacillus turpanensis]